MSRSAKGKPVDLAPGIAEFIAQSDRIFLPNYRDFPLAEQRAMYNALAAKFRRPRPAGMTVEDRAVAAGQRDIPVRIYRPVGLPQPSAAFLYLHGGGWIFGDLESHDSVTADLAEAAGLTVIAVDYRLAPEHPHPAAVEDSWDALLAVAADAAKFGIDPTRIVVGGDSAGGNLAAVLCLKAREAGGPALRGQILIYPGLGLGWDDAGPGAQVEDAPLLKADERDYYRKAYLGGAGATDDPHAAPLLAGDFHGLPPAYIMAVEHDPLRADAEIYARRLAENAVPVDLKIESGLVHGCLRARSLSPGAAAAFDAVCAATRRLVAG